MLLRVPLSWWGSQLHYRHCTSSESTERPWRADCSPWPSSVFSLGFCWRYYQTLPELARANDPNITPSSPFDKCVVSCLMPCLGTGFETCLKINWTFMQTSTTSPSSSLFSVKLWWLYVGWRLIYNSPIGAIFNEQNKMNIDGRRNLGILSHSSTPILNVRADRDVMKGNEEFINGFAFFAYQTIIYAVLKI